MYKWGGSAARMQTSIFYDSFFELGKCENVVNINTKGFKSNRF